MAIEPEQRREYFRRQKYRKVPLSNDDWRAYRLHAAEHDTTRTAFLAAVLRDYLAEPYPLKITARPQDWKHARHQRKDEGGAGCRERGAQLEGHRYEPRQSDPAGRNGGFVDRESIADDQSHPVVQVRGLVAWRIGGSEPWCWSR